MIQAWQEYAEHLAENNTIEELQELLNNTYRKISDCIELDITGREWEQAINRAIIELQIKEDC